MPSQLTRATYSRYNIDAISSHGKVARPCACSCAAMHRSEYTSTLTHMALLTQCSPSAHHAGAGAWSWAVGTLFDLPAVDRVCRQPQQVVCALVYSSRPR